MPSTVLLTALLPQGRISSSVWREQASETHNNLSSEGLVQVKLGRSLNPLYPLLVLQGWEVATFQGGMLILQGIELLRFMLLKRLGIAAFEIREKIFGLCPLYFKLKSIIFFLKDQHCLGTICVHWSLVILLGTTFLAAKMWMMPLCCGQGEVQNSRACPVLVTTTSQLSHPPQQGGTAVTVLFSLQPSPYFNRCLG